MSPSVALIWAQAAGGVIGRDGVMPWHLSEDMVHFKQLTGANPVVMGRRTWESLPARFRPLTGRPNIVVTRQIDWAAEGADVAHSVEEALTLAAGLGGDTTWVIGGGEIYALLIDSADRLEVTEIAERFDGDTFAPPIPARWILSASDPESGWRASRTGLEYRFLSYRVR